ncbi:hypothetical protein ACN42_g622 [Penicillium freii]|uniref:Uncharacterized protein n=1 Tax=Penicillium freii TaxID=48697 RepID=A0A117NS72_PENFR|nr:hypothetical protein ACN42_g622 [Penicillium freii]
MGKGARKGIEVGERTNQATVSRDQSRVEGSVVVGQAGEECFLSIIIKLVPQLPVPDYPRRTDRADAGLMSEQLVDTGKAGP